MDLERGIGKRIWLELEMFSGYFRRFYRRWQTGNVCVPKTNERNKHTRISYLL